MRDHSPIPEPRPQPAPAPQRPAAQFLGGPQPHLNDPHPMKDDPRYDKYRGRRRRRRPKSKPPPS